MAQNDFLKSEKITISSNAGERRLVDPPVPGNMSAEEYQRLYNRFHYCQYFDVVDLRNRAVASLDKASIVVEKPGLFYRWQLSENIGFFDTILFTEAGRFSLLSIYKQLREKSQEFQKLSHHHGNQVSKVFFDNFKVDYSQPLENWFRTYFYSTFNHVIPFPAASMEEVEKTDVWKAISADAHTVMSGGRLDFKVKLAKEENVYENYILLQERYLPIVVAPTGHYHLYAPTKDLNFKRLEKLPSYSSVDTSIFWNAFFNAHNNLRVSYPNFQKAASASPICLVCFDVQTNTLVLSPDLIHEFHELVLKDFDKFFSGTLSTQLQKLKELIQTLKPANEFREIINKYFESRGFSSFKVTATYPADFIGFTTRAPFKAKDAVHHNQPTEDLGYYLNISYKDKPYLGPNFSKLPGYVFVRPDYSLVHSSWCQHVTRWSQDKDGVTDQEYKVWNILDWLTGPYAEKVDAKIDEAPFVFMGRLNKSKEKAKVLAQMRDNLARLAAETT